MTEIIVQTLNTFNLYGKITDFKKNKDFDATLRRINSSGVEFR